MPGPAKARVKPWACAGKNNVGLFSMAWRLLERRQIMATVITGPAGYREERASAGKRYAMRLAYEPNKEILVC